MIINKILNVVRIVLSALSILLCTLLLVWMIKEIFALIIE